MIDQKNRFRFVIFLIAIACFSACQGSDGKDGTSYVSLTWTSIGADSIFVSRNSSFPPGDSVATLKKGYSTLCEIKIYSSNLDQYKNKNYASESGTFCYGTITAGIVSSYNSINVEVDEGESADPMQATWWPESGEDGEDKYYTVSIDDYLIVY